MSLVHLSLYIMPIEDKSSDKITVGRESLDEMTVDSFFTQNNNKRDVFNQLGVFIHKE